MTHSQILKPIESSSSCVTNSFGPMTIDDMVSMFPITLGSNFRNYFKNIYIFWEEPVIDGRVTEVEAQH